MFQDDFLQQVWYRFKLMVRLTTNVTVPFLKVLEQKPTTDVAWNIATGETWGIKPEISKWLNETCTGRWRYERDFYSSNCVFKFAKKQEAMLFKLTWG